MQEEREDAVFMVLELRAIENRNVVTNRDKRLGYNSWRITIPFRGHSAEHKVHIGPREPTQRGSPSLELSSEPKRIKVSQRAINQAARWTRSILGRTNKQLTSFTIVTPLCRRWRVPRGRQGNIGGKRCEERSSGDRIKIGRKSMPVDIKNTGRCTIFL